MTWTTEQKVDYLLRQPWTIYAETTPEGDRLLRVKELPAAVGCGDDDDSLIADFWESLRATLEAYLAMGSSPPRPALAPAYPWERPAVPVAAAQEVAFREGVQRVYSRSTTGSFQRPGPGVNVQALDLCAVA